eukprot:212181-Prorocentrum_minimum.AAC.1
MKCRLEDVKRQAAAWEVEGCDPDAADRRRAGNGTRSGHAGRVSIFTDGSGAGARNRAAGVAGGDAE